MAHDHLNHYFIFDRMIDRPSNKCKQMQLQYSALYSKTNMIFTDLNLCMYII